MLVSSILFLLESGPAIGINPTLCFGSLDSTNVEGFPTDHGTYYLMGNQLIWFMYLHVLFLYHIHICEG